MVLPPEKVRDRHLLLQTQLRLSASISCNQGALARLTRCRTRVYARTRFPQGQLPHNVGDFGNQASPDSRAPLRLSYKVFLPMVPFQIEGLLHMLSPAPRHTAVAYSPSWLMLISASRSSGSASFPLSSLRMMANGAPICPG